MKIQRELRLEASPNLLPGEKVVDLFAGAGGASRGIERALGRSPDYAVNHDLLAIETHRLNHPATWHLRENVWKVRPLEVTLGEPVGLLWASPDCRHFSRAKGGKPVSRRVRSLANVVVKWAKAVRPRVICLENVLEFEGWGPLGPDGKPDKSRKGQYFRRWKASLERLGYAVEHRALNAADFGAHTKRVRFFLVARRDGRPIRWPAPTHGPGRPQPHQAAADIVDWSLPVPSIFDRKKPLAEATLRRIARGVDRYVLHDPKPFIVNLTHGGRLEPLDEPLRTVTGAHRGEKAVVVPHLLTNTTGHAGRAVAEPAPTLTTGNQQALVAATLVKGGYGEREGQAPRALDVRRPLGTVVAGGTKHALCAAVLKHYGGVVGQDARAPLGTVTSIDHHSLLAAVLTRRNGIKGRESRARSPRAPLATVTTRDQNEVAAVHLTKFYNTTTGQDLRDPVATVTGKGQHLGVVATHVTKFRGNGAGRSCRDPLPTIVAGHSETRPGGGGHKLGLVYSFLTKYHGTAVGAKLAAPLSTVTSKHRLGVVTVQIDGEEYVIADIGLRMLQPHELAAAHGFERDYFLLGTKTDQVRLIGNSVPWRPAAALVRANLVEDLP